MIQLIPENIMKRIRSQGIIRTVYYAFFVMVLPKLGINIKHVYGKESKDLHYKYSCDNDLRVDAINSYSEFTSSDINELIEFEGNDLLEKIKFEFKRDNTCVLVRNNREDLAGLCWLEDISNCNHNKKIYLIRDGFVFPKFRGNNYFPALIDASYVHAITLHQDKDTLVIANVILGNYSSCQGLVKANFHHLGISLNFMGKQLINFPFSDK